MMTASHVARELVTLRLDTGTELDLTPQHLLFFEEMGWMPAGLAEPGWTLRADLGPVRVAAVDRGIPFRRVYNIEVGLAHTFRVSRERVVTHNGSSPIGGRDFEAEFQRIQAGRAALRPQRSALRAQAGVGAGPRSMEPIGERASRLDRDFGIRANVKLGSSTYGNDLFPAEDPWAGQATPTVDYDGEP
jgi:hypothetical protein